MDLKEFSGLWVCFGLDADSATMNANGRSEPIVTDAARSIDGGYAQKADFAKSSLSPKRTCTELNEIGFRRFQKKGV